mgnify:CR=1 FL=1|jgi:hypothetical protein
MEPIYTISIAVIIGILLFLLFREILCWYWKINSRLAMLTEIRDLLAAQRLDSGHTPLPSADQEYDKARTKANKRDDEDIWLK